MYLAKVGAKAGATSQECHGNHGYFRMYRQTKVVVLVMCAAYLRNYSYSYGGSRYYAVHWG